MSSAAAATPASIPHRRGVAIEARDIKQRDINKWVETIVDHHGEDVRVEGRLWHIAAEPTKIVLKIGPTFVTVIPQHTVTLGSR